MDYTLASLVSEVKSRIGDEEYPEEDIKRYLNEAQFEILGEDKYPFLERIEESTEIGSGEMDTPLDFQSAFALTAIGEDCYRRNLTYTPPKEFFADTGTLPAFSFTVYGTKIFYKLPLNLKECGCPELHLIRLMYLARPRVMEEDDDEPIIPPEYRETLIYGALARVERARDNFDYAHVYETKLDEMLVNMKLRVFDRNLAGGVRSKLPFHKIGGADYA